MVKSLFGSKLFFQGALISLALFSANCSGKTYSTFFQPFDLVFRRARQFFCFSLFINGNAFDEHAGDADLFKAGDPGNGAAGCELPHY
jgi:hypothetical protein